MRFRNKQKAIYFAIDQTLMRRHHILKLAAVFINVAALIAVIFASILTNNNKPTYAASYAWDGGGTTNNWSDCDNWSTNICPVAGDSVTFNATSTKDSTIDASWGGSLTGLSIASGYTGTITMGRSLSVSSVFSQAAGAFSAGSHTLDLNNSFTLSAGNFTASSGTMSVASAFNITGGTFNHNNGTIDFDGTVAHQITCNNQSFNRVVFSATSVNITTVNSGCNLPLGSNPTIPKRLTLNGTLTGTGVLQLTAIFDYNASGSLSGFNGLQSATTFTVYGNLNFTGYSTVEFTGSLILNSGAAFTAPSGTMSAASAFTINPGATFNHNNGTVIFGTAGATITCNNAVFNLVAFQHTTNLKTISAGCNLPLGNNPNVGRITLAGTLSGSGTLTLNSTSVNILSNGASLSGFDGLAVTSSLTLDTNATVDFSNLESAVISTSLILNSGANFTGPASLTVNGNFTNNGTANLSNTAADFNNSFILNNGSTYIAPSSSMSVANAFTINTGVTFNHNNGKLIFDSNSTSTLSCNNAVFNYVEFQHSGIVKTISADCLFPLGANPTIPSSITLNGSLTGSGMLSRTAGATIINATGTITGFSSIENTSTLTLNGVTLDWSTMDSLVVGAAFVANTGTVFAAPATADFNGSFTLNSGSAFTAPSGTMTAATAFTINSGATFDHNNGTVTLDGTNTLTATCNNAVFNLVNLHFTGIYTLNSNCNFPLGHNPEILGRVYVNGALSGSGTLTTQYSNVSTDVFTLNAGSQLTGFSGLVSGLTIDGAVLDTSNYSLVDLSKLELNSGTFTAPSGEMSVAGNFSVGPGAAFNHSNGTVIFDRPDNTNRYVVACDGAAFAHVVLNYAKTINQDCVMPLGHNPAVLVGDGYANYVLRGTLAGSGTIHIAPDGDHNTTRGIQLVDSGNLAGFTGISTGRLMLSNNTLNLSNYNLVEIRGAQLELLSASTLVAPPVLLASGNITVDSDSNFNANNGSVILNGANQVLTGSITFNNLTKTSSAPATLTFGAGSATTVNGALTFRGTSANPLSLASSTPDSQWSINATGSRNLRYLNVKDSNNISSSPMLAYDSEDSGNNINWQFPFTQTETTGAVTNFGLAQASLAAAAATAQQQQNIKASFANVPGIRGALSRLTSVMDKLPGGRETVMALLRVAVIGLTSMVVIVLAIWIVARGRRREVVHSLGYKS